jgi:hypothetical protein
MSSLGRLDDQLAGWLHAEAADPAPMDLVADVLARTSRRRPRARWIAVIHELPVSAGRGPVSASMTRLAWVALMLLLTLLVAVGVIAGSRLLQERPVITSIAPDPLLERDSHQAFRLRDGRVLILGDSNSLGNTADGALVDPWTGEVKAVPMLEGRSWGMAAAMLDDGRILIVGGSIDVGTRHAETFDPSTDAFTPAGDTTSARGAAIVIKAFSPVAVALNDGRILVIGGTTAQSASRTFPRPGDVFDPSTGTFRATPALPCAGTSDAGGNAGQEVRTADLLPDGRILLSCERWWNPRYGADVDADVPDQRFFAFDLETGEAEPVDIGVGLVASTTRLQDGSLLLWVVSGSETLANREERDDYSFTRFDPRDLTHVDLGVDVTWGTAASVLGSGQVVLAGGYEPGTGTPSDRVQLLDPCSGETSTVATLTTTRVGGTITELDDRHLLLVGGQVGQDPDMDQPALPEVVTLGAVPPACTG